MAFFANDGIRFTSKMCAVCVFVLWVTNSMVEKKKKILYTILATLFDFIFGSVTASHHGY